MVNWTPEMDATLIECIERRETVLIASDIIGVADGTARKRAKQLGLKFERTPAKPKKPAKQSMEMAFCDLLADGVEPGIAGDMLGYASGNSVFQRIRSKLGWQAV